MISMRYRTNSKIILFLLPYPLNRAPSQRFRVEAFFDLLRKEGISYRTDSFINPRIWNILYHQGSILLKLFAVASGFFRRFWIVLSVAPQYEYIFIHREAAPIGPPVFEWLLSKVLRKKVIYDFDDAIWITAVSDTNRLAEWVECCWKIKYICKWAYKIAAGNDYLADYARDFNTNVTVLPTCVDTKTRFNKLQQHESVDKVVIGWTGSHSTLPYLNAVVPALKQLEKDFDFEFLVICNQAPIFKLRSLKFTYWQEGTEIADLLRVHIGIMPLQADAWSEGKCGFKIIQYLSLGIPAVASPVGVNKTIIEEGINGFLCTGTRNWYEALSLLLNNFNARKEMGRAGREKIIDAFSIFSNSGKFLSLFNNATS